MIRVCVFVKKADLYKICIIDMNNIKNTSLGGG